MSEFKIGKLHRIDSVFTSLIPVFTDSRLTSCIDHTRPPNAGFCHSLRPSDGEIFVLLDYIVVSKNLDLIELEYGEMIEAKILTSSGNIGYIDIYQNELVEVI